MNKQPIESLFVLADLALAWFQACVDANHAAAKTV